MKKREKSGLLAADGQASRPMTAWPNALLLCTLKVWFKAQPMNIMCPLFFVSILVGNKNRVTWSMIPQKSMVFVWNHAGQDLRVQKLSAILVSFHCPFSDLRGNNHFAMQLVQCWLQFCDMEALLYWGTVFIFLVSSGLLGWKDIEFCQRLFCVYSEEYVIFSFVFFMFCIIFICLSMMNQPCIPGMKAT
jgi:hypothetical protein